MHIYKRYVNWSPLWMRSKQWTPKRLERYLQAAFWSLCGDWHAGHPQSSLTIKHYNTRVFLSYMAAPSGHKFGFTQSYGRSYGGIVPVFIEFIGFKPMLPCLHEVSIDYTQLLRWPAMHRPRCLRGKRRGVHSPSYIHYGVHFHWDHWFKEHL